jgi:hypothetical protein
MRSIDTKFYSAKLRSENLLTDEQTRRETGYKDIEAY